MEDCQHEKLVLLCAIDKGERELAKENPAVVTMHPSVRKGCASRGSEGGVERPSKLQTKAERTGLVPSLCLQGLESRLGSEQNAH